MNKELTRMPERMPERPAASQQYPSAASYSFEQIQRMAIAFAKSGLFGVKDADQALALMLHAQATGKHPALVMKDYDIIQNRLAKKAEAMLRDFQVSGGRVEWTKYADDGVTGVFSHPLAPKPVTVSWNLERAKKAGLATKDGAMYSKFAAAMFRSRCISEGVRTIAPDATEQLYTPEEARQIEDDKPAPSVSVNTAVAEAAQQVTNALPEEQVEELVNSLDVKTLSELITAFGKAYTIAKTAGDKAAMDRLKLCYDDMKSMLERGGSDAPF
jgi:hypothetical protein